MEISQRSNYYDATPITAFDQNAIELYGLRIASTVTAHEICDPNVAQTSAQLILQRGLYIRNLYEFKLSWEYCLLEPMDLVTLTDANLGLDNVAVRIIEVQEDGDGLLSITAEEFPGGTATAVAYPVQTNNNVLPFNRTAMPASVNAPVIFEPPASLAGATPQIWIALSGGSGGLVDPNWGGANVWASLDGASYVAIGQVSAPARQGVLAAALPAYSRVNPDLTDTLSVNLAESGGALASTTAAAAAQAVTLMIVGGEFMTYETATLTGANAYQLTGLYRGLYGSGAVAHAIGASVARLDGAIFKYALPNSYIGQPLYLKFQSFNIFGGGLQDLSDCTAYTFSPAGGGSADPVAAQLASGLQTDLGQASDAVAIADDFGTVGAGAVIDAIDLGAVG
ncbi:phage tail protein [Methylovirgula ligni]|uniref:phage tail protein n=1 Tax=Methylovirgula ligni TaxID=569860 RepID=UPI001FE10CBB|nr:phage tail protein [Methylovirgula ligni]